MKDDCSRHKKEVAGISDMKQLAEMIGDLHYEALSTFLYYLSDKVFHDGKKDFDNGRTQLAGHLFEAQQNLHRAHQKIDKASKLCEPFMNPNNTQS